jgi:hypothetical protein
MTRAVVMYLCAGIWTDHRHATLACEGWITDRAGVPVVRYWTPPKPHKPLRTTTRTK